jgi:alanyl-tRNA synthetase
LPSNVERGYVLRRILRRAILHSKILNLPRNSIIEAAKKVIEIYKDIYPEVLSNQVDILTVIENEKERFEKTLETGLKKLKLQIENCKLRNEKILPGKVVFDLFQSCGFPFEITREIAKEEGLEVDEKDFKERFKKHQEISRVGAEKKFGGLGKVIDYNMVKLHTATHLLHAALREILGPKVKQTGSDITPERLRFDFSFDRKLTKEETKKVEDLVNQKIKEDLEVKKEEMSLKEALESGALAFFKEKYPERVTVYTIGNFSKETCAGPHVKRTSELGKFKIVKEESAGSGVRRIRAILE